MPESKRDWLREVYLHRAQLQRDPALTAVIHSRMLRTFPAMHTPEQVDQIMERVRAGQVHSSDGTTDVSENVNRYLYGESA